MTTSGTIAKTVIDNSSIIEHALRRNGILPSAQTPEIVLIAQECLYMLLLNLGNRGLNLWCVNKVLMGLVPGKTTYTLPAGTLDVLNMAHSRPVLADGTFSSGTLSLNTPSQVLRVGVDFSSSYTGPLNVMGLSVLSDTYLQGVTYWFDPEVVATQSSVTVTGNLAPISGIKAVIQLYDLPLTQWNRDTYLALNEKNKQGTPSTNYFFEKKLTPTVTLWPVPNNADAHITMFTHRQPQDVGTLTQQLDIPQRWLDGFIWLLSARTCFEVPGVTSEKINLCVQMADKQTFEAELSETDGAPISITPGISVYTR